MRADAEQLDERCTPEDFDGRTTMTFRKVIEPHARDACGPPVDDTGVNESVALKGRSP